MTQAGSRPASFRIRPFWLLLALFMVWLTGLSTTSDPLQVLSDYYHFFFLGITGAIVANSTGSGGGIVFIPSFTALGLTSMQAVGTSILIQCFGMTAGSISWLLASRETEAEHPQQARLLRELLLISALTAIPGMIIGQQIFPVPPFDIRLIFQVFSVLFGVTLLILTLRRSNHHRTHYHLSKSDAGLVAITGVVGGVVTSWISVGVGEWLALLLFVRGYPTMVSVALAVCISSITVISGMAFHTFTVSSVVWEVILFAAPAAIIGGSIARFLAQRLGAIRLKIFFATWILVTGLIM